LKLNKLKSIEMDKKMGNGKYAVIDYFPKVYNSWQTFMMIAQKQLPWYYFL